MILLHAGAMLKYPVSGDTVLGLIPEGWAIPGLSNVKMGPAALSPPQPTVPEAFKSLMHAGLADRTVPHFCLQLCDIGDACSTANACSKKGAPSQPLKMPAMLLDRSKAWDESMQVPQVGELGLIYIRLSL